MTMILGKTEPGDSIKIDLNRLIETRLLLNANSGGGKSYTLRKILEETYGHVQQIIIDVEDEFYTLCNKFDYIRAGGANPDCPAYPTVAATLARKLLELNHSAIVSIYELKPQERKSFVRQFLNAIINAEKSLWHNVMIVIDEADVFCPQTGEAESSDSVKDLMCRGRKRGFCGVLATQRISKLHKDAVAEANNKLLGRCGLDIDMKRTGDELGLYGRAADQLRSLKPCEFFCFGPAFNTDPVKIKIGPVSTPKPEFGKAAGPPPTPRAKVQKILGQLADIPRQAKEALQTEADYKRRIAELEKQVRDIPAAKVETKIVEKPILTKADVTLLSGLQDSLIADTKKIIDIQTRIMASLHVPIAKPIQAQLGKYIVNPPKARAIENYPPASTRSGPPTVSFQSNGALPIGEKSILSALIQFPEGLAREQLTVLTGYKRSSRDAYVFRIIKRGYARTEGNGVFATDEGHAALPNAEPLPTGEALRDYWLQRLPEGERKILEVLISSHPDFVDKDALSESTGYKRSSRDAYLHRLVAKQLVVNERASARASDNLF